MSDTKDLQQITESISIKALPESSQKYITALLNEGMEVIRCKGDIDLNGYVILLELAFTGLKQEDLKIQLIFENNQRD